MLNILEGFLHSDFWLAAGPVPTWSIWRASVAGSAPEWRALLDTIPGNSGNLRRLGEQAKTRIGLIPFVGAGLSIPLGFPGWTDFLVRTAGQTGFIKIIRRRIALGQFEEAAEDLMRVLGPQAFDDAVNDAYGDHQLRDTQLEGAVTILPHLIAGPVITTNFDHVLETAFKSDGREFDHIVWGAKTDLFAKAWREDRHILLKIHGDVEDSTDRIIAVSDYARHYGSPDVTQVDSTLPLPRLLKMLLASRPVLFLGCSLAKDRTLSILKVLSAEATVPNYAIVERPKSPSQFRQRARYLSIHNIRPVWYPYGRHDFLERILAHLVTETPRQLLPARGRGVEGKVGTRVLKKARGRALPHRGVTKSRVQPVRNVPYRNNYFAKRPGLQTEIALQLNSHQRVALWGLGGVGKTQVAIEYAHDKARGYWLVWWIDASDPSSLDSGFGQLAHRLRRPEAKATADVVEAVGLYLDQHTDWLLIFDNATEPKILARYLPRGNSGHVLITSQNPEWGSIAHPLPVGPFTPEEARAFLLMRTKQTDAEFADALAEEVEYLPLALEQAGAYMAATGRSLSSYSELFKHRRRDLLAFAVSATDYRHTVMTTWSLAIENVREKEPAGAKLLNVCAFLAPADIPKTLLMSAKSDEVFEDLIVAIGKDSMLFDKAVSALRSYSLVTPKEDYISLHRLLQEVVRYQLQSAAGSWAETGVRLVFTVFPEDTEDRTAWSSCSRLLPHALTAAEHANSLGVNSPVTTQLLNRAGEYLNTRAEFEKARAVFERALTIDTLARGPTHPDVARDSRKLGSVLHSMENFSTARLHLEHALAIDSLPENSDQASVAKDAIALGSLMESVGTVHRALELFRQALRIDEAIFGGDSTVVANDLSHLGGVLLTLGEVDEAERVYQRAMIIDEASYGATHPRIARDASNLASVLYARRDDSNAWILYERALRIDEGWYGAEHPMVAIRNSNLGSLLWAREQFEDALSYYEKALKINVAAFGAKHSAVAGVLNDIGTVLHKMNRLQEALSHLEQALAINEAAFGPTHPDVAQNLNNIGLLLGDLRKYDIARQNIQRAREINETAFGTVHPEVGKNINNLGVVASNESKWEEAEGFFEQVVAMNKLLYGPQHPEVSRALNNLAYVLQRRGNMERARECYELALQIDEAIWGWTHTDVARDAMNLGDLLREQGFPSQALELHEKSKQVIVSKLGSEHPEMAKALWNIAMDLKGLGRFWESKSNLERALEIDRLALGTDHPNVGFRLETLGDVQRELENAESARTQYEEAIAIYRKHFGEEHRHTVSVREKLKQVE